MRMCDTIRYQSMCRAAAAGGGDHGVVRDRRRGDVEQRDGGEEEEQERRRRQRGAARAPVAADAPPRLDHFPRPGAQLREAERGHLGGELVPVAAAATWDAGLPLDQWLFELGKGMVYCGIVRRMSSTTLFVSLLHVQTKSIL